MKFEPFEFQHLGIDWLKDYNRPNAAIFGGMGLGKSSMTLSALDWLFKDGDIKGALIIAPLRVSVLTWPYEIQKWDNFKWMKVALLRTKEGMQAWHDGSAHIYLLNYEMIPKFCREGLLGKRVKDMPADVVIWDELSKCKSHKSKRLNGCTREKNKKKIRIPGFRQFNSKFAKHWGLTGTPRPNGYADLFSQIRLLDEGAALGRSFDAFQDAYFQIKDKHTTFPKYIPLDWAPGVIDSKIADLALVLRSEDWLDIPPVTTEDIDVVLPASAKKHYKEMQNEFLTVVEEQGLEVAAFNKGVSMGKLQQITSGEVYDEDRNVAYIHDAKIKALKKLQKEYKGQPLLVGTGFKHEQARILKECEGAELFNDTTLDRWERGEIKMLVADPRAIAHGVDRLQGGGKTVVWFTLPQLGSSELYDQFNSRIARTGQKHETKIIRLLCSGTVDDVVAFTIDNKIVGQSEFQAAVKALQDLARLKAA